MAASAHERSSIGHFVLLVRPGSISYAHSSRAEELVMNAEELDRLSIGFLLAGFVNFVVLIAPIGLIEPLGIVDPHFDNAGCVLIGLWGVAYVSIRHSYRQMPLLCAVFAIEKLSYVHRWTTWFNSERPPLSSIYADNPVHGVFFTIYGAVDATFMVLFVMATVVANRSSKQVGQV